MRIDSAVLGALGVIAMFTVAPLAPAAWAEPASSPPAPEPVIAAPAAPAAADTPATPLAASAEGVPHLLSPENLPPGTSATPVVPEGRRLAYLRDLWHALQTQEVSGSDALLLLTQRPMDPDATPPPGKPAGPQAPVAGPSASIAP